MPPSRQHWPELLLFLLFFGSRAFALTALPLHNDEGLHLTRAVEVWNLHPFYDIEDGKVAGVWVIALFYPQSSPVFVGRIATLFVGLIGLAGGMAAGRLVSQRRAGGLLAGLLWITCPYLFFFERLALADIEAGAVAVLLVAILLPGLRLPRRDVLAGLALGAALLFKVSAAPFVGVPLLAIWLTRRQSWRVRLTRLAIIYAIALIVIAPAGLYSAIRGGFFSIARGWVGGPTRTLIERTAENVTTFADTTLTVNGLWALALIGAPLSLMAGRRGLYVLGCALGPLGVMLLFGTEVLDRHFGVVMPLLAVVSGVGWVSLPVKLPTGLHRLRCPAVVGALVVGLAWVWVWAWRAAYTDPPSFPLTVPMREQYISQHPSGYGLREAVEALPQTVGTHPVIGSMTSDGCRRARFYLPTGSSLECTGVGQQSRPLIEKTLQTDHVAYVLAEDQPVGIDPASISATWTPLAVYPRPGGLTRITLWRVTP